LIKTLNGHTDQISCLVVLENGYLVSSSKGLFITIRFKWLISVTLT